MQTLTNALVDFSATFALTDGRTCTIRSPANQTLCPLSLTARVENGDRDDRNGVILEKTSEMALEFEKVISRFPDQWYNFYSYWL